MNTMKCWTRYFPLFSSGISLLKDFLDKVPEKGGAARYELKTTQPSTFATIVEEQHEKRSKQQ
jgi:hypothetical protein